MSEHAPGPRSPDQDGPSFEKYGVECGGPGKKPEPGEKQEPGRKHASGSCGHCGGIHDDD